MSAIFKMAAKTWHKKWAVKIQPPPCVLFITYVIGAMLEDWQKIGHTFESRHPIDTFISYLVQIGTHGFREAFLNNRLTDVRCLVMAKPHISYKC